MKNRLRPRAQRGVAMITAVLIVSLATIAATAIALSNDAAIRRATILQETERAWWFATGVQSWVRTILERDGKETRIDALNEEWAQPVDYLPLQEGFIRGQIIDQQGLFNLNNLGVENPEDYVRYADQFRRLLESVEGVDPFVAPRLAPAIRDWIDADLEPTPYDGAEDNEYLQLDQAYRAANRPLASVTELLSVRGVTPDLFRALRPYVTALPRIPSPINVNTAPEPVLRALVARPGAEFESFLADRFEQPVEQLSQLEEAGLFVDPEDAPISDLVVSSQFFLLQAETTIGNSRVALYSLYYRPALGTPVLLAQSADAL